MDNLQPGQRLGPYQVIGQIGQGGMATVYKAYHAAMDRYVALKILPRQLAENPEFTGRFQQEARIIANLEHPHILPVHDYGESEGVTYLVMRYLDGGTLKDRMHERPLSLAEVDRLFVQLTDALEYAHAQGVIHRDLKPSNVLVDARGNLFLTDFGIAKLLEGSPQFTGTGALMGTPDYMSPEQAQGLKVDQRTDIYSLGIILYEMVTGRVPFEAETPLAVILKHLNDPLPLPTSIKPDLSPAIERVLLKALAKAPNDRFASTAEFHEAWKKALTEASAQQALPPAEALPANPVSPSASETSRPGPAVAASASAATPLASANAVAPPRRKLPWAGIAVGVGAVVMLALCGGLALLQINFRLWPTEPATKLVVVTIAASPTRGMVVAAPAPSATPPAEATAPVVSQASATPAARAQWTSWVGANHLWSIAVNGDEIVAGGRGLTLWNRKDGTLIREITSLADGLPNVFVNAILIGNGGALWVATSDGVGLFDGQQWTRFGQQDGLDSTSVNALAWLPEGLLAGTQYCGADGCGLNLFTSDGVKPVPGFPSAMADDQPGKVSHSVTALLTTPEGEIWAGTMRGLARFEPKAQKWTTYFLADGLPNETIGSLLLDRDGALWVGTSRGAAKFNGTRFESVEHLQDTGVLGMVQDSQGRYWFACDNGLQRFAPPAGQTPAKWEIYTQGDGLPSLGYYAAVMDGDGNMYFGSDGGVVRYNGQAFSTWTVPNVPVFGNYGKILPAPDGAPFGEALWFVEQYGGPLVDRFDERSETWSLVGNLPDGCSPLAVDADRAVWCGGAEGLWVLTADSGQTHLTVDQGLPSNEVVAIALPPSAKGSAWVGTANAGVALYEGQKISQLLNSENAGLTSNDVHALLAASDGSLWVGTDKGLDRLQPNGQWEHYTVGHPFGEGLAYITALAEDAGGAIWVSAVGEGSAVHRFAEGQWQLFTDGASGVKLPQDFVQALAAAPDGSVWFGGYYSGGARFDEKEWTLFGPRDGLIHSNINNIYVDQSGAVWFATDGGVTRYMP